MSGLISDSYILYNLREKIFQNTTFWRDLQISFLPNIYTYTIVHSHQLYIYSSYCLPDLYLAVELASEDFIV